MQQRQQQLTHFFLSVAPQVTKSTTWTWRAAPVRRPTSVPSPSSRRWMRPCAIPKGCTWSWATTTTTLRASCWCWPAGPCPNSTASPWSCSAVITRSAQPWQDWKDCDEGHTHTKPQSRQNVWDHQPRVTELYFLTMMHLFPPWVFPWTKDFCVLPVFLGWGGARFKLFHADVFLCDSYSMLLWIKLRNIQGWGYYWFIVIHADGCIH